MTININPEITETRSDGTPYRVERVVIEATNKSDQIILGAMADIFSRCTEFHFTPNTLRVKGTPKKKARKAAPCKVKQ